MLILRGNTYVAGRNSGQTLGIFCYKINNMSTEVFNLEQKNKFLYFLYENI